MRSESAVPGSIDSFLLSLPSGWQSLPVDEESLVRQFEERAAQELTVDQRESDDFRHARLWLRRLGEIVKNADLSLAASWLAGNDPSTNDKAPATGSIEVLGAALCLLARRASDLGVDQIEFDALMGATDAPGDDLLQAPTVTQLSAGPAVRRVTTRQQRGLPPDEALTILDCRYSLLIGPGEGVAVLGFTTPNAEIADQWIALFEAIANTLEFVRA
jgi:hypothetical protein